MATGDTAKAGQTQKSTGVKRVSPPPSERQTDESDDTESPDLRFSLRRQAAIVPAERSLGTGTGATHGDVAYAWPRLCTRSDAAPLSATHKLRRPAPENSPGPSRGPTRLAAVKSVVVRSGALHAFVVTPVPTSWRSPGRSVDGPPGHSTVLILMRIRKSKADVELAPELDQKYQRRAGRKVRRLA